MNKVFKADAEIFYNRGWCKYKLGKYKAAIEDFDKAIELKGIITKAFINKIIAVIALIFLK